MVLATSFGVTPCMILTLSTTCIWLVEKKKMMESKIIKPILNLSEFGVRKTDRSCKRATNIRIFNRTIVRRNANIRKRNRKFIPKSNLFQTKIPSRFRTASALSTSHNRLAASSEIDDRTKGWKRSKWQFNFLQNWKGKKNYGLINCLCHWRCHSVCIILYNYFILFLKEKYQKKKNTWSANFESLIISWFCFVQRLQKKLQLLSKETLFLCESKLNNYQSFRKQFDWPNVNVALEQIQQSTRSKSTTILFTFGRTNPLWKSK